MPMADPIYQSDSRTFLLTVLDEDGVAPTVDMSAWVVVFAMKLDDDDTDEAVRKTSATATEIEAVPAGQNPDGNKWYIYLLAADTAALDACRYVIFVKLVTDDATPDEYTVLREDIEVLAEGATAP